MPWGLSYPTAIVAVTSRGRAKGIETFGGRIDGSVQPSGCSGVAEPGTTRMEGEPK
jgi:hypothetical protein